MSYSSIYYFLWSKICDFIANTRWCSIHSLFNGGVYWSLTEADHVYLRNALRDNYFIICTSRSCHLTTYLIRILSWIKGSSNSFYAHTLLNTEDGNAAKNDDFKLMEATGAGVHYSTFMQVFDCDAVALLKPTNMTLEDWTAAIDAARLENGLPYDDIFNLLDATHVSCVEMIWNALKKVPDYESKFPNMIATIAKEGNLTPQMFYNSQDFSIHWEVKR